MYASVKHKTSGLQGGCYLTENDKFQVFGSDYNIQSMLIVYIE